MRKIKKKKKRNELNEMKIEKESIIRRFFNFFKRKKEIGVFIKGKKLKIVDRSKIKIPSKALSEGTLIPINFLLSNKEEKYEF